MKRLLFVLTITFLPYSALAEATKIGALLCLTGPCAADGQAALNGMTLAVEQLESASGLKQYEIISQDTAESTNGAAAVTAYRRLYASGIRIFVGPSWSSAAQALAPIIAKDKEVVALTPSAGTPDFHMAGENIFNLRGTDGFAVSRTAEIAWKMGIKKMAIFGSQQSWSMEQTNTFETAFKNLGGKILSKVEPLPGETLLASHAFRLIATKPDAIFISVFAESPIAVKQLAAKKYTGNKFAAAVHPVLLEQARPEFEGTIFNTFTMPTGDFANKYKARFNGEPLVAAGGGYDAVKVINAGIGTSRRYSTLAQAISAVILPGAFGRVEFDEQGCVIREPEALQVKNGNIVPYEGN